MDIQTNNPIVTIRFTVNDVKYPFTDALNFTPAEYASVTPEQIVEMQHSRFLSYVDSIENPLPAPNTESE